MKCILMNKNTEVLVADYNDVLKGFDNIIEIKNILYAPIIISNLYEKNEDILNYLSKWFRGRGIPNHRDNLEMLLARLNVSTPEELLDKSFGLSLSDQYWIKPVGSDMNYSEINFFENDFEDFEFLEATFSNKGKCVSEETLLTPNNTTDGMLKKSWIIEDDKRYLIKGGFRNELLQPFNEVLGSMISKRLGFEYTPYTLDILNDKVVSKCACFIDTNTEYVPAYQVMSLKKLDSAYETYISILSNNGILNAREKTENMFILDFLLLNEDRHMNNFGIIRDVNTLKWLNITPIFDNGQSLNVIGYDNEEMIINGQGKFFYDVDNFDNIIKIVKNIKRIDIHKLDGLVEEFDDLLHKYQHITKISDDRIHRLCMLLNRQIKKINEIINNA